MYVCDVCGKEVKDLKSHKARMHPLPGAEKQEGETKTQANGQTLDIKEPEGASSDYHCVECGGSLTKGQSPCPNCGATLDWSAVE